MFVDGLCPSFVFLGCCLVLVMACIYLYPNDEVGLLLTPVVMLGLCLGGVVMVV